jgi:hypothetical protein
LILAALMVTGCQSSISGDESTTSGISAPEAPEAPENPAPYSTPLRLGDRNFVASVLSGLFIPASVTGPESGEKADLTNLLQSLVKDKNEDFGGAHDIFASFSLVDEATARRSRANYASSNTSIRASLSLRAIYELVRERTYNLGIRNIIGLVRGVAYSQVDLSTLQAPTASEISSLILLISPGSSPSPETVTSFQDLATQVYQTSTKPNPALKNQEVWRFVILAALSSLTWQLL